MRRTFWFLLYNILIIPLQYVGFYLLSPFVGKIRRGIRGRKHLWDELETFVRHRNSERDLFIVHCASLGEYEMAKPVIEGLRTSREPADIVLTFFSPSGYDKVSDTAVADLITYLPFDSVRQVDRFYRLLRPDKLILTSYEIWPNLVWMAQRHDIESYLISARFQVSGARVLRPVQSFYGSLYGAIDHIYPIAEEDESNFYRCLRNWDKPKIERLGNTRFDRVLSRAESQRNENNSLLPVQFRHAPTFIAGSIWPSDMRVILSGISQVIRSNPEVKLVLAPHEPTESHLAHLSKWSRKHDLEYEYFSEIDALPPGARVLLVDGVGYLAELYHDCDIAYVGGGFSGSVHNVMEPAVARCAVAFGPQHQNSFEAEMLIRADGGECLESGEDVARFLSRLLNQPEKLQQMRQQAYTVVREHSGASSKTVERILAS